jgi:hypothetical protein
MKFHCELLQYCGFPSNLDIAARFGDAEENRCYNAGATSGLHKFLDADSGARTCCTNIARRIFQSATILDAGDRGFTLQASSAIEVCLLLKKEFWGQENIWRRERDSNPRYLLRHNGFQDRRYKPLTHPSAGV